MKINRLMYGLLCVYISNQSLGQSTTVLTYDASGNRISKKVQGSSPNLTVVANPKAVSPNQPATLMASACPGTVQWSTGQQGSAITVTQTVTTQYIANCVVAGCANNGVGKATVDLIQCTADEITTGVSSQNVKYGQPVTLSAYGCTGTVQWSTGNMGNTAIVKVYGPSTSFTANCIKPYCNNSVSAPIVITGSVSTVCAAGDVLVTKQTGSWNNPDTWQCGRIPTASDEVYLGHVVTVDNIVGNARTVILGGGYVLRQNGGSVTLQPN